MNIGILHGSNDQYGASRVLIQDVELLIELGHHVTVCLPTEGPLTSLLKGLGASIRITDLVVLRKTSGLAGLALPHRIPVELANADLVVIWTLALAGYLPLLKARRILSVTSVHEILDSTAGRLLAVLTCSLSTGVMTNSDATTRWLTKHFAPKAIGRAYPVAPTYNPRPLSSSPRGSVRLLLAGRMNGHKGQIEAIQASELARTQGSKVTLRLVGGPFPGQEPFAEQIHGLAADRDWVQLAGELDDIGEDLGWCDAVLMPTTKPEPFGLVAVEAWAAGRLVIGSDCGGLSEAIDLVDGIKVRPQDPRALAETIELVASKPELRGITSPNAPASSTCTAHARRETWAATLRLAAATRS